MIYWIFVILTLLSIAINCFVYKMNNEYWDGNKKGEITEFCYHHCEVLEISSAIISVISGIAVFIMLVFIIAANVSAVGVREEYKQTYNALMYKSQTESIRDEFGIVDKEYVDEVQSWNEEIAKYKAYSNSFWIGIFYPSNVFEDLKTIDLNEIKMKE